MASWAAPRSSGLRRSRRVCTCACRREGAANASRRRKDLVSWPPWQASERTDLLPLPARYFDLACHRESRAPPAGRPSSTNCALQFCQRERSVSRVILAALESKLLAAGQNHFGETHRGRAVLGGIACDGDLIARLEDALAPAASRERGDAHCFGNPVLRFARGVLHIEENLSVRILEAE